MKRFSLRALLLCVAMICLAIKVGLVIKERRETRSLAECVAEANAKAAQDELGKLAPPLTEKAVLTWIEMRLQAVDDPDWVQRQLRRIVRSGRLPLDARLDGGRTTWIERVWFVNSVRREWDYDLYLTLEGGYTFSMEIPTASGPDAYSGPRPPSFRWWAKTLADAR
jgi:hypothetical protein